MRRFMVGPAFLAEDRFVSFGLKRYFAFCAAFTADGFICVGFMEGFE